jgi:hypothetical protein
VISAPPNKMIHSYGGMIVIMILAGLGSSMYLWADKLTDVRLSVNDAYMILLMTAWMCLFMAISNRDWGGAAMSAAAVAALLIGIRGQLFVPLSQFYTGMIPHHSMAVHMSRRLLVNDPTLSPADREFVASIIKTQEREIEWMKQRS